MKVATLPNPSRQASEWLTSLEPWQIEAVQTVREAYGVDGDALIRAGLTLLLSVVAALPGTVVAALIGARGADARRVGEDRDDGR